MIEGFSIVGINDLQDLKAYYVVIPVSGCLLKFIYTSYICIIYRYILVYTSILRVFSHYFDVIVVALYIMNVTSLLKFKRRRWRWQQNDDGEERSREGKSAPRLPMIDNRSPPRRGA